MSKTKTIPLTTGEINKMMAAVYQKPKGISDRDFLCLLLMRDTGARIGEIQKIKPDVIDWSQRRIYVSKAKDDSTGYVYFTTETERELRKWIAKHDIKNNKEIWDCSKRTLQRIPERYAVKAGIWNPINKEGKRPSCHSFRKAFANRFIDAGFPEVKVKRMMRHKDLSTTDIYYDDNPGVQKDDYDAVMGK